MRCVCGSLLVIFLVPQCASAQTIGLGVSVDSDTAFYVPVDVNSTFRLEPYVRMSSSSDESDLEYGEIAENGRTDNHTESEWSDLHIGVGGFGTLRTVDGKLRTYLGARIAYVNASNEYYSERTSLYLEGTSTHSWFNSNRYTTDLTGVHFPPTIGFE